MFFTITVIVIVLMSVTVHELAHAIAMRECGVRVERISLLGLPGIGTIRLPISSRYFPGTEWVVHPLIIGAYVQPVDEDMNRLSPRDQAYIAAMGPMGSIAFAFACIGIFCLVQLFMPRQTSDAVHTAAAAIALVVVMWQERRFIARYLMLPLMILGALIAIKFVVVMATNPVGITDGIAIANAAGARLREGGSLANTDLLNGILYGAIFTALYGLLEAMPAMLFDGGSIVTAYLPRKWHSRYLTLSVPVAVFVMAPPLLKDAYNLIRWTFALVIGS